MIDDFDQLYALVADTAQLASEFSSLPSSSAVDAGVFSDFWQDPVVVPELDGLEVAGQHTDALADYPGMGSSDAALRAADPFSVPDRNEALDTPRDACPDRLAEAEPQSSADTEWGQDTGVDVNNELAFDAASTPGEDLAGTPSGEDYWHQQEASNSCAVAVQRGVIESLTGMCIPEAELSRVAEASGWYDPTCGTQPSAVGNLLELYGVPVERSYGAGLADLYDALQRGEKVLVGLDANEIWTPSVDLDGLPVEQSDAGHAVQVTEIRAGSDGGFEVVMNDPGRADGAGFTTHLEHFENAWEDFGNYAVITRTKEAGIA